MFIKSLSLGAALCAVACLAAVNSRGADTVISSFDVDTDSWIATWGTTPDVTFSPLDATGLSTSGSLLVSAPYIVDASAWQQSVITKPFDPAIDLSQYASINLDVKIDPTSIPNASGNYGYFEVKNPNGGAALATGVNLTSTDWTHLSFPIPASVTSLDGLIIQLGAGDYKGPVAYNLDNVTLTPRDTPPAPPTLNLSRARAGLSLVTTSSDPYGRHNIYTTDNTAFSFVNADAPVSYSFTIDNFPDAAAYPNFQGHIFLVPGNPGTETSPDWNEPTLIFVDIRAGANNSGSAVFRSKVDQAGGNSQLYAGGLTTVSSATVLGTWTVTIDGASNTATMTAPDGTVSDPIDISALAPAFADGNLRVYFGAQPNSDQNKGQSIHVAKAEIKKGTDVLLHDDFNGDALDPQWTANASPGGVQFVAASDASWVLTWTLPDTNYKVQMATTLSNADWTDIDVSATTATVGSTLKQAVIATSALPATGNVFFRLVQPVP